MCQHHSNKSDVVIMHQLSKCASQKPFNKSKGLIKKAYFHTRKPHLIIMTNSNVYIFDLKKQEISKKLKSGADWNSSLSIHPHGDNLVVGSEDKKVIIKLFSYYGMIWIWEISLTKLSSTMKEVSLQQTSTPNTHC